MKQSKESFGLYSQVQVNSEREALLSDLEGNYNKMVKKCIVLLRMKF